MDVHHSTYSENVGDGTGGRIEWHGMAWQTYNKLSGLDRWQVPCRHVSRTELNRECERASAGRGADS